MRRLIYVTIAALFWAAGAFAHCQMDHVHLSGPWGRATFDVELASTPAQREVGLMNRDRLPIQSGMLFIYQNESPRQFWMRNTRIPLDILYFDAAGQLVSIVKQAVPFDETTLPSDGPAQYVLEINGGLADRYRIGGETVIGHPQINNFSNEPVCHE